MALKSVNIWQSYRQN